MSYPIWGLLHWPDMGFCSPFPSGIPKVELRTGVGASFLSVFQIESVPHQGFSGDNKKAQGGTTWCCLCQGMVYTLSAGEWISEWGCALYIQHCMSVLYESEINEQFSLSNNRSRCFVCWQCSLLFIWTKIETSFVKCLNVYHCQIVNNGAEKWTDLQFLFQYCRTPSISSLHVNPLSLHSDALVSIVTTSLWFYFWFI